jgi:hypothetical protein
MIVFWSIPGWSAGVSTGAAGAAKETVCWRQLLVKMACVGMVCP